MNKRQSGQYYTNKNPFAHFIFKEWAKRAGLLDNIVLEPFAGSNNIIKMLQDLSLCSFYNSFDIEPKAKDVYFRDTLKDFPKGYKVAITNPPYLAKYSARRRKLYYPETQYDDLYKYCLSICLYNVDYLAAIIPASFLNSSLFLDRLSIYIALPYKDMFLDTECPVCLALFEPKVDKTLIFEKDLFIGELSKLNKYIPKPKPNTNNVVFNDKEGELGFIAIDNAIEPSIRFVSGDEIQKEKVKFSSRSITRINIKDNVSNNFIKNLNNLVCEVREKTGDVFLTPFKGIRKDGRFRRRMEYGFARNLILSL